MLFTVERETERRQTLAAKKKYGAVEINVKKEVEIDKGKKNGKIKRKEKKMKKIERKIKAYYRHFALLYQTFFPSR